MAIHIDCVHLCCICRLVALLLHFRRTHKDFLRSGKNVPNSWAGVSKEDTFLIHLFLRLRGNDVALKLVSPEFGPAGVEGDIISLAGHATRTHPSNGGIH